MNYYVTNAFSFFLFVPKNFLKSVSEPLVPDAGYLVFPRHWAGQLN